MLVMSLGVFLKDKEPSGSVFGLSAIKISEIISWAAIKGSINYIAVLYITSFVKYWYLLALTWIL
jgi:hypothetical protein